MEFRGKTVTLRGFKRLAGWAGNDLVQATGFWLDIPKRTRLEQEFVGCRSLSDYYHFSKKAIGLMQHEPEILGLLEHVAAIAPRNVCEIGTYEGGRLTWAGKVGTGAGWNGAYLRDLRRRLDRLRAPASPFEPPVADSWLRRNALWVRPA